MFQQNARHTGRAQSIVPPPPVFWLSFDRKSGLILNSTIPGTSRVEYTDSLRPPITWTPWLTNGLSSDSSPVSKSAPADGMRFYRAVLRPGL
jgi:hypothetical protein